MDSPLRTVLGLYPAAVQPLAEPEPLGNAGGLSGARLWRYRSGRGLLVVRAWPPDGPPRAALERIHGWLRAAADLGIVPVPEPARDGSTVQERAGRCWEVAPWLPGEAERTEEPPPARCRAALSALAAFHQRLSGERTSDLSPGLIARLREAEILLRGGLARLKQVVEAAPDGRANAAAQRWMRLAGPLLPALADRLRGALAAPVPLQPCLRDARPEHWLFQGDRVSGLVDFGAMGIECVAADLGRLLSEWGRCEAPTRAEGLGAYEAIRPLEVGERNLIELFETSSALLGPFHWVRWHFLEGRTFDEPDAAARGIERGTARLERIAAGGA